MEKEFTVLNLDQGSDEWKKFRNSCVGASDIPVLMGKIPGKTPYSLWLEKTGRVAPSRETYLMSRGKRLEQRARELAEEKFGISLMNPVIQRKDFPWAIASLDGATADFSTVVEIKCPHLSTFIEVATSKKIPEHTYLQTQWQMYVLGQQAKKIEVEYFSNDETLFLTSQRNDELISEIVAVAKDFHQNIVLDIPPEFGINETYLIDDENFIQQSKIVAELSAKYKEFKDKLDHEKAKLLDLTDGGNCKCDVLSITWNSGKKTIDYKKLLDDLNVTEDVISKYIKEGIPYPVIKINEKAS